MANAGKDAMVANPNLQLIVTQKGILGHNGLKSGSRSINGPGCGSHPARLQPHNLQQQPIALWAKGPPVQRKALSQLASRWSVLSGDRINSV